jgi:ketosteroid isomerase-like protein
MKPILIALLLVPLSSAFAQVKIKKAPVVELLIQMEKDWSEADVKKDAAALERILADDWIGIDFQGVVLDKPEVLKQVALHSDVTETETTEMEQMKIRLFGNTAIVSGTEIETSQYKGKDSSGKYAWTDVFVRRNGRWQAVSSQSTKLPVKEEPDVLAFRKTASHTHDRY